MIYTVEMNRKTIVDKLKAKKKNLKKKTSVTLDPELYARFVSACEKEHLSVSALLEELIREFLNSKA